MDKNTTFNAEIWSPDPAEVARLAYAYYEERGSAHGSHAEDWYRAERELRLRYQEQQAALPSPTEARTAVAVFSSLNDAHRALDDLHGEGFEPDEISFIANRTGTKGSAEEASDIAADAGIGAAVGGVGGLLLGLAGLAIPGIGPVLAAGPIVAALGGAGLGAAAGGLIGALAQGGVPEDVAAHYAEGVRRGEILITVQASNQRADRAAEILNRNGAADIDERLNAWRNRGWTRHDPNAEPLSDDELRRERDYYVAAKQQGEEWSKRASRVF